MSTTDHAVGLDAAISSIRLLVATIIFETAFFGIYTLLIVQSTYILLHKDFRLKSIRWMLAVTGVMYILSAMHWAAILSRLLSILHSQGRIAVDSSYRMGLIATISTGLNLLLSDAVVMWRVYVLWGRNKIVLISCSLSFLATAEAALFSKGQNVLRTAYGIYLGTASLVTFCLSLATNMWSTALIAYKAWYYRRNIAAHIRRCSRKSMVEKVLTLLLESGALYASIQIITLAFGNLSSTITFEVVLLGVLPQVSGIYPTIIVVLVCLQETHCDQNFTYADVEISGAQQEFATQDLSGFELVHRPADTTRSEAIVIIGTTTVGDSDAGSSLENDDAKV
ncbi:hypothetical protein OF83DRAFT_166769 [Amylostereum chailletii]|nr:hypothetical protein OF83DRAFT_166769 [Amylostereum chailletii]